MAQEVKCAICGQNNMAGLETCQYCGSRLLPATEPLGPIRVGDAPTKKDTSDLEGTLPTWLRGLRGNEEEESAPASPAQGQPESPASNLFSGAARSESNQPKDFLAGLSQSAESDDDELPDWLTGLGGTPAPQKSAPAKVEPEPATANDSNDWLANLGGASTSAPQQEETPNAWFNETPQAEESFEPTPANDSNDWLANLGAASATLAEETPASNWQEEAPKQSFESAPSNSEAPDWLKNLEQPSSSTPAYTTPAPASDDTPAWMRAESNEQEFSKPSTYESPAAPAGDLPDWLSNLGQSDTPAESKPTSEPDWLQQSSAPASSGFSFEESKPASSSFDFSEPQTPAWDAAPAQNDAAPDWLSSLPGAQEFEGSASFADLTPAAPAIQNTPPAPKDSPFVGDDSSAGAIFSMETPDWLSSLTPSDEKSKPSAASAPEESLQASELPSWVKAMRPVESVIGDSASAGNEKSVIENKGPLAGLRDVLPALAGGLSIRRPPVYSNKLELDEGQQNNATLLETLLAGESRARPLTKSEGLTSGKLMRMFIALVLIVATAAPLILNLQLAPSNNLRPPETTAVAQFLSQEFQPNAPVLMVFDYEPALSGELEAASMPVIDHLMLNGARLTIISTSPTGSALGEKVITLFQPIHRYQAGQQYLDLGYLAGGVAGISGFAHNPSLVMPNDVNGNSVWGTSPVLENVNKLSDFAAVFVLTDSADTGRAWIEQTGEHLGDTKLFMLISAQAEPMLLPYYDSNQVQGVVTGLAGGAAYEQGNGRPIVGRIYWDAYSLSFLSAEGLIAVGAVLSLLGALRDRNKQKDEE